MQVFDVPKVNDTANLRAELARANEFIGYLIASRDSADKRAADYFKLAETRLEWAVKLQDKINALRARIVDLSEGRDQ
jgi:hypothetical protein